MADRFLGAPYLIFELWRHIDDFYHNSSRIFNNNLDRFLGLLCSGSSNWTVTASCSSAQLFSWWEKACLSGLDWYVSFWNYQFYCIFYPSHCFIEQALYDRYFQTIFRMSFVYQISHLFLLESIQSYTILDHRRPATKSVSSVVL